ncbi:MAG: CHAT domain-containing protein [Sphingobacteriales bacterium]|nr:MAG: CHAT domain-containing protein [Sphingobacteriales bacterium]
MKSAQYAVVFFLLLFCTIGLIAQPVPKDLEGQINYYLEKGTKALKKEKNSQAISNYEKALELSIIGKGNTDTLVAFCYEQLGHVYGNIKDIQKSIKYYTQAAEIWKGIKGNESEEYLLKTMIIFESSVMNNYLDESSKTYIFDFLEGAEMEVEEQDTIWFNLLFGTAKLFDDNELYSDAVLLYEKAYNKSKLMWGENHKNNINLLGFLAMDYYSLGDFEKADSLFQESLNLWNINKLKIQHKYIDVLIVTAEFYKKMGFYFRLIDLYLDAIEVTNELYGENNTEHAKFINQLAETYEVIGLYEAAIPLREQYLQIMTTIFGTKHPEYAMALNNLAVLYTKMGAFEEVENFYMSALSVLKGSSFKKRYYYAVTLNNLAQYYGLTSNFTKSEQLFLKALSIIKKIAPNSETHMEVLYNLSEIYRITANYEKAEFFCYQSIQMKKEELGENHYKYALSVVSLAETERAKSNFEVAENLFIYALSLLEESLGEEHIYYATTLNNLALLYADWGFYTEAEKLFYEVLYTAEITIGKNRPFYAIFLNNLANLYLAKGDYLKSESLQLEAISITRSALGENNIYYANSLNGLAVLYTNMGLYSTAESLLLKYLTVVKEILGKENLNYAEGLNNLCFLFSCVEEYEQAEKYCKESLSIQYTFLEENNQNYVSKLNNLGIIYYKMGKHDQSEPLLLEALSFQKNISDENHLNYAITLNNLALLYDKVGELEKAKLLYQESLGIVKSTIGENNAGNALILTNLAQLNTQTQNYPTAYPLYTQAMQIYQNQIIQNFTGLSERDREQYFNAIKYNFEAFHSFAYKAHKTIPQTLSKDYDYTLFIKGLQLATSQQMRNRIAASADTTLLADYENWLGQRRFLGKLYEKTIEQRKIIGINIDSLEEAANRAEADLARRSEALAEATDTVRYTWQDVQKQLKAGEAAVEIARFNWYNKDWTDTVYYALMVVTPQTKEHPDVVWLEYGKDLEGSHFKNYTGAMKRGENDFDSYLQYWKPLDSLLQGANKVYLSLDGIYHKINLETLITPEGKYLGDEKELHLVGSTKDLVKHRKAVTSTLSAVLLGNPAYSADSTTLAITAGQFKKSYNHRCLSSRQYPFRYILPEPLPGTQTEIDQIGAVLTQAGYSVKSYSGKEAAEEAVKSANSPRILHLATHGAFLEISDKPEELNRMQYLADMDIKRAIENPLLRSQLYFSGAQETLSGKYPANATYDNGVLTAYEAVNLNLKGTELVVLSACETGLGEVRNGEGVFGMQRAFQVAGAQSVMMSLREVSDAATSLFMNTFYQNFLETGNKRQAFKAAQQTLRNTSDYKHPYYWGAFVLVGE